MKILQILVSVFVIIFTFDIATQILSSNDEPEIALGRKVAGAEWGEERREGGAQTPWAVGGACVCLALLLRLLTRRRSDEPRLRRADSFLTCKLSQTSLSSGIELVPNNSDSSRLVPLEDVHFLLEDLRTFTEGKMEELEKRLDGYEQNAKLWTKRIEQNESQLSFMHNQFIEEESKKCESVAEIANKKEVSLNRDEKVEKELKKVDSVIYDLLKTPCAEIKKKMFKSRETSPEYRTGTRTNSPTGKRCCEDLKEIRLRGSEERSLSPDTGALSITRSISPEARSCSPVLRSISPDAKSCSPVLRSISPEARSCSPVLRSISPESRSCSPVLKSISPESRSCSPVLKSISPEERSCSPVSRSVSYISPRQRESTSSAEVRARTPEAKGRSLSPSFKPRQVAPCDLQQKVKIELPEEKAAENLIKSFPQGMKTLGGLEGEVTSDIERSSGLGENQTASEHRRYPELVDFQGDSKKNSAGREALAKLELLKNEVKETMKQKSKVRKGSPAKGCRQPRV